MHTLNIILSIALLTTSIFFLLLMTQVFWEKSVEGWGSMLLAIAGSILGVSFWVPELEITGLVVLSVCMILRVTSVLKSRKKR